MRKNDLKSIGILIVIVLFLFSITACNKKKDDNNGTTDPAPNENVELNIDGSPIEVEPYTNENGAPEINEDGHPVYQVKNQVDENGAPVLVVGSGAASENGHFVYTVQEKAADGTIKDKTATQKETVIKDGKEVDKDVEAPVTTIFTGSSGNIPTTTKSQGVTDATSGSNTPATTQPATAVAKDLPETIDLGGIWGKVTKAEKYGKNVYRGQLDTSKLVTFDKAVTYSGINATFTRGVYVPEKIGNYEVVEVAYIRLYPFYDQFENGYDYYMERGIFSPGNDRDPLVYFETNDTFTMPKDTQSLVTTFLLKLA